MLLMTTSDIWAPVCITEGFPPRTTLCGHRVNKWWTPIYYIYASGARVSYHPDKVTCTKCKIEYRGRG